MGGRYAPVREAIIRFPRRHDGCKEANANSHAVKGHMNSLRAWVEWDMLMKTLMHTIRYQTEAVCPHPVEKLDEHVREIEHKKIEDLPRLVVG